MGKSALVIFMSLFIAFATTSASAKETKAQKTAASKSSKTAKHTVTSAKSTKAQPTSKQAAGKKSSKTAIASRESTKSGRTNKLAATESRGKAARRVSYTSNSRKATIQRVTYTPRVVAAPVISAGELAGLNLTRDPLDLKSSAALVLDQTNGQILFDKNSQIALPIASLTKLMTSMVVVEARQNMSEVLTVTDDDVDREKHSSSRLRVGSELSRTDMLHIALMSSENRAASALGRNYPGGLPAFVAAMNAKARSLGMVDTHYVDSTGLSSQNVASARDLAKLVAAAYQQPLIREYSTDSKYVVEPNGHPLQYATSNYLVENPDWQIGLQKTGYINEAGNCLVMQSNVNGRPVIMVFLDSHGKYSRQADASRVRKWLVENSSPSLTRTKVADRQT